MKKYIIGNMKMNMDKNSLISYFKKLKECAKKSENYVGVCVPNVYLDMAEKYLSDSSIYYGVQNVYFADKGAYTGEISINMLNDFGTKLCIVGHSERRNIFNETDEMIANKLSKLIETDITPIFCFGEKLTERNDWQNIVSNQLCNGLKLCKSIDKIIFAYEPIWAIGTGVSATSDEAENVIGFVKNYLKQNFKITSPIVLYGGSMNTTNAIDLLSKPSIDGGLIGGACLNIDDFDKLINIVL